MLKHCAANRKRRLSALLNVSPYIYDVKICSFTRSSIYIYDISRLRVKRLRIKSQVLSKNIQLLMNKHQRDTLSLVYFITGQRCVLHRNLHAVNTHLTHTITPNSICAELPEDGRVTPETCRDIDS
jgi:hypothetical protein